MGLIHEDKSYALKIRESANDGSDFSNPEADYRVMFLGEDGLLKVKDSAGSVTDPYTGGASAVYDIERRSAGDINVTSTSTGAALPTLGTVTVAAIAGDVLEVGIQTRCTDTDANSLRIDVGTIVAAAVVNYFSSLAGTANAIGCPGWFVRGSQADIISGSMLYVVQSGDISGGNVELGIRAWLSGADTRPLAASTTSGELQFWVMNHG